MFKPYSESSGRSPDFRIRYKWLPQTEYESQQRLFQHMRSDFRYEEDGPQCAGIWCIYPEFEDDDYSVLPPNAEIATSGTATMWILFDENREIHRERIDVGTRGFLVVGERKIAQAEVIELLALVE